MPRFDWRRKTRWFAAEFLVVVSGILVALAFNAWWAERSAGAEERELLARPAGGVRRQPRYVRPICRPSTRARGKPTMIPESIPHKFHLLEDPATWDGWFVPCFDLIRSEGIGAFSYSNRDYTQVPAWSDWGDLRIEHSPLKDEWAEMLAQAVNGS